MTQKDIKSGFENNSNLDPEEYAAKVALSESLLKNQHMAEERDSKAKQLSLSLIVNLGLGIIVFVMFIGFLNYPKTKYIATKDNAAICEVYPTDNPNITDTTIREFGKEAVLSLYTVDYINFDKQVNSTLERYFTPTGREASELALRKAGVKDYLQRDALTFKASATNAARIQRHGINSDGKDYWVVKFPMVLDMFSGSTKPKDTQHNMVTVRVVADTASTNHPNGLGISSVNIDPLP